MWLPYSVNHYSVIYKHIVDIDLVIYLHEIYKISILNSHKHIFTFVEICNASFKCSKREIVGLNVHYLIRLYIEARSNLLH